MASGSIYRHVLYQHCTMERVGTPYNQVVPSMQQRLPRRPLHQLLRRQQLVVHLLVAPHPRVKIHRGLEAWGLELALQTTTTMSTTSQPTTTVENPASSLRKVAVTRATIAAFLTKQRLDPHPLVAPLPCDRPLVVRHRLPMRHRPALDPNHLLLEMRLQLPALRRHLERRPQLQQHRHHPSAELPLRGRLHSVALPRQLRPRIRSEGPVVVLAFPTQRRQCRLEAVVRFTRPQRLRPLVVARIPRRSDLQLPILHPSGQLHKRQILRRSEEPVIIQHRLEVEVLVRQLRHHQHPLVVARCSELLLPIRLRSEETKLLLVPLFPEHLHRLLLVSEVKRRLRRSLETSQRQIRHPLVHRLHLVAARRLLARLHRTRLLLVRLLQIRLLLVRLHQTRLLLVRLHPISHLLVRLRAHSGDKRRSNNLRLAPITAIKDRALEVREKLHASSLHRGTAALETTAAFLMRAAVPLLQIPLVVHGGDRYGTSLSLLIATYC